ncbi:MAG: site-specific integrase [Bacteroidota bacterium]
MNTVTINLWLRISQIQKDKEQKIYLRITINRASKIYTTGISVLSENWDQNKQRITRKDKEHSQKNDLIEKQYFKAKDIIYQFNMSETPVTFDNFEIEYQDKQHSKNPRLVDFMKLYIKEKTTLLEPTTIKRYNNALRKIEEYDPCLLVQNIDYNFLTRFELYLRDTCKNQHNTVTKEIKIIKTLFSEAQRRGLIPAGKQLNFSMNYKDVFKDFLTIEELKKLAEIIDKDVPINIKKVLFPFVFSCFTGLRLSDLFGLKYDDLKANFTFIDITTVKTKDRLIIPISEPTQALIHKYMNFDKNRFLNPGPGMSFFDMFSEQYSRAVLKTSCALVGITKRITFHSGRYTFATICNSIGIPIEVTSRLLSHKTLKMTLKYAKFTDQLLTDNVNKWNINF